MVVVNSLFILFWIWTQFSPSVAYELGLKPTFATLNGGKFPQNRLISSSGCKLFSKNDLSNPLWSNILAIASFSLFEFNLLCVDFESFFFCLQQERQFCQQYKCNLCWRNSSKRGWASIRISKSEKRGKRVSLTLFFFA